MKQYIRKLIFLKCNVGVGNSLIATMFVRQDYGITGYILSIVYICILIHVCSKSLTSDIHFWERKKIPALQ